MSAEVEVVNLGDTNSGAVRREEQARHGQVLLTVGGAEGVRHLAELFHQAASPIVPLDLPLGRPDDGSERLSRVAAGRPRDFFRAENGNEAGLLASVSMRTDRDPDAVASRIAELLNQLIAPRAFAVRLVDRENSDYPDVERYFDDVVGPVATEAGYQLVTAGRGTPEHAFLNNEVFELLHDAKVVIADLTGDRPNCYLELGYALGHRSPSIILARSHSRLHFDASSLPVHFWELGTPVEVLRDELARHWRAQVQRPAAVQRRSLE